MYKYLLRADITRGKVFNISASELRRQYFVSCISLSLNINRLLAYSSQQSNVQSFVNLSEAWLYLVFTSHTLLSVRAFHLTGELVHVACRGQHGVVKSHLFS